MVTHESKVDPIDRPSFEGITFHVQQCVEKLLKGALIARGIVPPFSHDLEELAALLEAAEPSWSWPNRVELAQLTRGAVLFRYPVSNVTRADSDEAVEIGTRLRASLLPSL